MLLILFILLFPSVCQADITTGLVGHWKMDETSGNAVDSSVSALNGTPTGTTIVPGRRNHARTFNGSSDLVSVTDSGSIYAFANTTFTVTAWAKISTTAGGFVVAKDASTMGWGVSMGAGVVQGITKNSGGNSSIRTSGNTSYGVDNLWHHIVVVFTTSTTVAANNTITIYVDGVLNQAALTSSLVYTSPTTSALTIGRRTSTPLYFPGSIDDVRIYNRGLTAADVSELYNQGFNLLNNAVLKNAAVN